MIEKACRTYLLNLAKAYAEKSGQALTTIARKCHGNCDFFEEFAAGKCSVTLKKYDEILAYLGGHAEPGPIASAAAAAKKVAVEKRANS